MRFFTAACLFGLIIASFGCMTNNWSRPLFGPGSDTAGAERAEPDFWHQPFGSKSGMDPRARQIEDRLGL